MLVAHKIIETVVQSPIFPFPFLFDFGLGWTLNLDLGLSIRLYDLDCQRMVLNGGVDQMQVSHVEKNMVEQSSTVPNSQSIRST